MKKTTVILFLTAIIFLTGCCVKKSETINSISGLKGKIIGKPQKGASYKSLDTFYLNLIGGSPKEVICYETANEVIIALLTSKVDGVFCQDFLTRYLVKVYTQIKPIPLNRTIYGGSVLYLRQDDSVLRNDINRAISIFMQNGSIRVLEEKWINSFTLNKDHSVLNVPLIEGAKTVKIGISGDVCSIDFISNNGCPPQYCNSIFTEIGKILNINFVYVTIDAPLRLEALKNNEIDIIPSHFIRTSDKYLKELIKKDYLNTNPIFMYNELFVLVKK